MVAPPRPELSLIRLEERENETSIVVRPNRAFGSFFQTVFLCFFWTSGAVVFGKVVCTHLNAIALVFGVVWIALVTLFLVRSVGSLLRRYEISVGRDRVMVVSRMLGVARTRALPIDAIRGVRWIEARGRGRMLVFDVAGRRVVVERPLTYPEANYLESELRTVLDARQRALAEAASEATLSGDTPYRAPPVARDAEAR